MHTTSLTLLERLRCRDDAEAWRRLVQLYTPLMYSWANRAGLQESDAADLVQDVFAILLEKLPAFQYDPSASFRSWLKTVLMNKLSDRRRRAAVRATVPLGENAEPAVADPAEEFWEREYQQVLLRSALDMIQPEFASQVWSAGTEFLFSGDSASVVANRLRTTENAVYISKCRVQRRLREVLTGLMD